MGLVIDGYNLLHAPMPPSLAGLEEDRLCRLLARGPWRGRVVVVCDGQPKPFAPASPVPEVELLYSGGRSADEVIEELIARDTAPRRLTVVSTDRQVQKAAKRRRCAAMTSEQFVTILTRLAATATPARPDRPVIDKLPRDEVQRWLDEFGISDT